MVELKLGPRTVDLPYTLRLYGVTAEVFEEMVDEDTKAELIDGVMIVHSPASPRHDVLSGFLRTLMNGYARRRGLGRVFGPNTLIHLTSCRRFAPDAFFLEQRRIPTPLPRDHFEGAPDLVLEVLSPSNRDEDLEDKRPAYSLKEIRHWLQVFAQRFYSFSQFKRSAVPNGPKVSHGGSLSPRGDWRAPSDMSARTWLDEIEREIPED